MQCAYERMDKETFEAGYGWLRGQKSPSRYI